MTGPDPVEDGIDNELRSVSFDGYSPREVFGQAAAWLAQRDGAVGVRDVGGHDVPDGEPCHLVIYYYRE